MRRSELMKTAVAFAGGVAVAAAFGLDLGTFDPAGPAVAQERGAGKGGSGGQGGGQGQARRGQGGIEINVMRGRDSVRIYLEDEGDEDSDRPAWARGNPDLNEHIGGSRGRPTGAGTKKGDLYGDLWIILRDANGEPVLDANGNVQPILVDGTVVQLTADGDLPEEYTDLVQEVDFGRMSVVRSPDRVTDQALEEALAKLANATEITLDAAGRLVVDGVAIDSPLENSALYIYLMSGGTIEGLPADFEVTSLLAAASDKSEPLTVDEVIYWNTITGVNSVDPVTGTVTYYDFSTFGDYSRVDTYKDLTVTYLKDTNGDGLYETVTEPVLVAVFNNEDWTDPTYDATTQKDAGYADDFTQAADDARAVIDFLHSVPVPTATE